MTEINYNDPIDKQLDAYAAALDPKIPEQRVLKNLLIDAAVKYRVAEYKYGIVLGALKKYADPVFWQKVPEESFASADLGNIATVAILTVEPV